ncbi:MAG: OB-fold nucleic acid binding domain-containing protein, partial [Candidatus Heimdallarchaeota archaeon]
SFSEIRGTIMKVYEGNLYYNSCPKCRKKVEETEGNWKCLEHGEITPEQVIFFSLALDDGTGCVRVTFFREHAEEILDQTPANIIDEIEQVGIQAIITKFEQRLKGREYIVRGKARKNKFDDGMDLIVSSFSEMDAKSEIELVKSTLKV